jgi:hypothetical protein
VVFDFLKGGKVEVNIELDRPTEFYHPGDAIHASVTLDGQKKMKVRQVKAELVHWERYRYDKTTTDMDDDDRTSTHSATAETIPVEEVLMEAGEIPAGSVQTYTLDWTIPDNAVPPYQGEITQSRWLVRVTLDRKLGLDTTAEVEVPLIVSPPGRDIQPGDYGSASHPGEADMRLWLPKLEWVEGETIEGKLLVRPQNDFKVSEVRIELQRKEHVPRDDGKTHTVTEGKAQLAPKTEFRANEVVEYPFSFSIPAQACPTRETPHSSVMWALTGTLNRSLRTDWTVGQQIIVYNGLRESSEPM